MNKVLGLILCLVLFAGIANAEIIEGVNSSGLPISIRTTENGKLISSSEAPERATVIVEVDDSVYVGTALVGTSTSSAVWQAKKIYTSSGTTTITWADGNSDYDNVATNLPGLTYN